MIRWGAPDAPSTRSCLKSSRIGLHVCFTECVRSKPKAFLSGTGTGGVGPRLSIWRGPQQNVCTRQEFSSWSRVLSGLEFVDTVAGFARFGFRLFWGKSG